jgi:hypothetical protein
MVITSWWYQVHHVVVDPQTSNACLNTNKQQHACWYLAAGNCSLDVELIIRIR